MSTQVPVKVTNPILRPPDFRHEMLRVGDLNMHAAIDGPEGGPLVVLLHGFPEFWYSWRYQIRALAGAGYRVVAPDQRGYNLTDKRGPYDAFTLANDVKALVQTLGYERATIAGHDWGGGIAWCVAAFYPEIAEKLIACNCPHPITVIKAMRSFYLPQLLSSIYILFFQVPRLPEAVLSANRYALLAWALKVANRPQRLTDEEIGYFREAWAQPGALSAALNWYRAAFRDQNRIAMRDMTVRVPARLIWGAPDPALTRHVAEQSRRYCPDLEIRYIPDTGHFVQQSAPEEVNRLMLEFLQRVR